jgi:hypothetical protein
MNGTTSSLTRNSGEKNPGTMHEAYFPNAYPKNLLWLMSYIHHENLQMNKPMNYNVGPVSVSPHT